MAASTGYLAPRPGGLAAAAAARSPFFAARNPSTAYQNTSTYPMTPKIPAKPPAKAPVPGGGLGVNAAGPTAPGAVFATGGQNPNGVRNNTAPTSSTVYDLNTDPALQQTLALTGLSDEQAQAAAASQRRNLLLNYGDANLASSVIGDPALAAAAAANPTSTLSQLATQHQTGVQDLTEQLNQANLLYSGYRTTQEQKASNDYQSALAAAAGNVNTALGGVTGSLNSALGANASQRAQAASDAYNAQLLALLANPPTAPVDTSGGGGGGGGGGMPVGAIQPGGGGTAAVNLDPSTFDPTAGTAAATGYYNPVTSQYVVGSPSAGAMNPANFTPATANTPIAAAAAAPAAPHYVYRNGMWVKV